MRTLDFKAHAGTGTRSFAHIGRPHASPTTRAQPLFETYVTAGDAHARVI